MILPIQLILGLFAYLLVVLPYVRGVSGRFPKGRRIYVCNHVSLLDTLVLGGIFWSRGRAPILVLGDRATWRRNPWLRFLSSRVGFLIDRDGSPRAMLRGLQEYAGKVDRFQLVVFPEGTRGDGRDVGECQPGIYTIAKACGAAIVPIYLDGMAAVTSKRSRFRPLRGLRRITVRIGEEFELGDASRAEFLTAVRERLRQLRS